MRRERQRKSKNNSTVTKRLHNSCLTLRPRNRWEDFPFVSSLLFPLILHTSYQYLQSSFPLSSRHLPFIFLLNSRRHLTVLSSVPLSNPASFRYLLVIFSLTYLTRQLYLIFTCLSSILPPYFHYSSRHFHLPSFELFPFSLNSPSCHHPTDLLMVFPLTFSLSFLWPPRTLSTYLPVTFPLILPCSSYLFCSHLSFDLLVIFLLIFPSFFH